ncbi:MAG: hypothetical protein WBB28_14630 [Crinalium sp.]
MSTIKNAILTEEEIWEEAFAQAILPYCLKDWEEPLIEEWQEHE